MADSDLVRTGITEYPGGIGSTGMINDDASGNRRGRADLVSRVKARSPGQSS
jgi:hypothetical protein